MPTPVDRALYESVKAEAKRRFRRWPSAYGSAWLSKTYRARGGRYRRRRSSRSSRSSQGVARWMREEWVQVEPYLDDGRVVPCGDARRDGKACRPRRRVSRRTPPTLDELVRKHGRSKVRSLARRKSRDMAGRVDWVRGRFTTVEKKNRDRS